MDLFPGTVAYLLRFRSMYLKKNKNLSALAVTKCVSEGQHVDYIYNIYIHTYIFYQFVMGLASFALEIHPLDSFYGLEIAWQVY